MEAVLGLTNDDRRVTKEARHAGLPIEWGNHIATAMPRA